VAISWVAHDNLCLDSLFRNGNADQRRRYVPGLCKGTSVGALALTEPGAGSDAIGSMRTSARRDGDRYILNGTKLYITNGPIADVFIVYARLDPIGNQPDAAAGHRPSVGAFIVEKGCAGFSVAQKLSKMGFRGSPTGELVFENCSVPAASLLGGENGGLAVLMGGLGHRARDDRADVPGHRRARAGVERRLCEGTASVRAADWQFSDGSRQAGRHVRVGGDDAVFHVSRAAGRRARRGRRRRPRRDTS
jgi:hypothetical protein